MYRFLHNCSLLLASSIILIFLLSSCQTDQQRPNQQSGSAQNQEGKIYTRDEFKQLVMAKSTDDIIRLLGRPNSTSDLGGGSMWWFYNNRTKDEYSGKVDMYAQLVFESFSNSSYVKSVVFQ